MNKIKVSLKLDRLSVSNKVELARSFVSSMTGNPNFSSPSPALSVITTAADNLDNAIVAAQDKSRTKMALMHAAEATLDNLLTQLGLYVEATANNNEAIILSAGMSAKHTSSAPQLPVAPAALTATNTSTEGEVLLHWKRVANAHSYIVEISSDAAATSSTTSGTTTTATARVFINWAFADVVTKCKCALNRLSSGIKYAIRVYAVGAAGKGTRSVPVVVKVL